MPEDAGPVDNGILMEGLLISELLAVASVEVKVSLSEVSILITNSVIHLNSRRRQNDGCDDNEACDDDSRGSRYSVIRYERGRVV